MPYATWMNYTPEYINKEHKENTQETFISKGDLQLHLSTNKK